MIENPLNTIPYRCRWPRTKQDIVGIQLGLVLTTAIVLLLTFIVPINRLSLLECPFLNITGLPGPFCGFTRSIWAISAGDWTFATVNCPLAWPLYAALVIVFAGNITSLLTGMKTKRLFSLCLTRHQANRAAGIIFGLILLNWIYRLSTGLT